MTSEVLYTNKWLYTTPLYPLLSNTIGWVFDSFPIRSCKLEIQKCEERRLWEWRHEPDHKSGVCQLFQSRTIDPGMAGIMRQARWEFSWDCFVLPVSTLLSLAFGELNIILTVSKGGKYHGGQRCHNNHALYSCFALKVSDRHLVCNLEKRY